MGGKPRCKKFEIVAGYGFSNREIRTAYPEIERLRSVHGELNRKIVLAEAKKKNSPLHDIWDWDVEQAAEQHWLRRAADLLRAVKCCVTILDDGGEERVVEVRVYHPIDHNVGAQGGGTKRSFEHVDDVMTSDFMRSQVIDGFFAEMERLRRAYETFMELAPVFQACERIKRKQARKKKRAEAQKKRR